ncbi:MAG: hypothetical protein M3552_18330 [Planctomycetota bacterium]|nr:hypothetical protein [Planctomycetaceae bacterium]MDQ3332577.1 hypothetical protein [Planctomycetota bacterium]
MIALATTSLVTVAAFAFAVHQFVLKYLYDQSSYTRTPGGVLMIMLGFAGICLPIVLLRKRQRFLSLRPSRQWLLTVGISLVYVLVLAVCLEASHRSRTIILPRPFTPTAIVHYRPGDSRVEFRGGWRPDVGPAGYNDAEVLADGSEEFSSYLHQSFIRDAHAGPETVAIIGRAERGNDGSVQIILEVDAREAIRFSVENLDDVTIMRDGRPLVESQSQSGTFQVTITGRLKKGA